MKYLLFLALEPLGLIAIVYSYHIVKMFGRLDWAEQYLGGGGSYAAWKLIGVGAIIAGFAVLVYL